MGFEAIGPIAGGVIGNLASQGDVDAANANYQKAIDILNGVKVPTAEELSIVFDQLAQQGTLTPELQTALTQKTTEMGGITTPQELKDVQSSALKSLMMTGKTGLSLEDKAALADVQRGVRTQEQGNEGAIIQNMQSRGMGGSGSELAARLSSSQGAADRASQQGMQVAGQAQANALRAIQGAGTLGGQQQAQDFSQKAATARAADEINRFNTANQQQVQGQNVASKNLAQERNLGEKQRVSDTNIGLQNQSKMLHRQDLSNIYNMQMEKAGAISGANYRQAGQNMANAGRTAGMWGGIGQGVGQMVAGAEMAGGGGGGGGESGGPQQVGGERNVDLNGMDGSGNNPTYYADGGPVGYSNGGMIGQLSSLAPLIMMAMKRGGAVPGIANVSGDSTRNDTVPAMLSPGEFVLPRSVMNSSNPPVAAAKMVAKKKPHDPTKFIADVLHHLSRKKSEENNGQS